jgi:hypothetical protein
MSNRYRRERRPDGVLLIDTLEHRSVLIVWDQVGDQGDGLQKDWLWHYSRDLPPEPQPRVDLCRYPHVLQAGACCERSPCKYHEGADVRVLEIAGPPGTVRPVRWIDRSLL